MKDWKIFCIVYLFSIIIIIIIITDKAFLAPYNSFFCFHKKVLLSFVIFITEAYHRIEY